VTEEGVVGIGEGGVVIGLTGVGLIIEVCLIGELMGFIGLGVG
jgi:hypothetical protein